MCDSGFIHSGKSYFRGPWLLTPPEIPGIGNRLFYRQELMLSTVQETNPLVAIVGRCMVLELNEYSTSKIKHSSIIYQYKIQIMFTQLVRRRSLKAMCLFARPSTMSTRSRCGATSKDWDCANSRTARW